MQACRLVAGSGAKNQPEGASCSFSSSTVMPGSTRHTPAPASSSTSPQQLREISITTARFVHWPARLVPPARASTGAPCSAHTPTARAASSTLAGITTPSGSTWYSDASVA
jgi:hypothetical protein